jgi:hypothetical protein
VVQAGRHLADFAWFCVVRVFMLLHDIIKRYRVSTPGNPYAIVVAAVPAAIAACIRPVSGL